MVIKRPSQKGSRLSLFIALLLFLFIGCATVPETGRRELMLIPESQELALGVKSYREIMSKSRLSHDQEIGEMVGRVGGNVARATSRDYSIAKDYQWEFNVIEGERMSQVLLAQLGEAALNAAVNNQSPEALKAVNIGYRVVTTVGVLLPYNRLQESEADHIGLLLVAKAGYDPREAISFWGRMAKAGGTNPPAFLSTHPTDEKRIAQIKEWMPEALRYYRPYRGIQKRFSNCCFPQ